MIWIDFNRKERQKGEITKKTERQKKQQDSKLERQNNSKKYNENRTERKLKLSRLQK
jgi:hypothetical protein